MAAPGDCILIAGKRHENDQIIGDKFHSFSDRQMIIDRLNNSIVSKQNEKEFFCVS